MEKHPRARINFQNHRFDYVVMTQALQAVLRPDQILNEMLREMAQESVDLHGDANNGVPRLMEILRDQDFSPQVRENKGKVELSLMSCPFRSVAINNPSLCAYDIAVIEAVSACPVERIACLSNGDSVCKYLIGIRTSDGVSAI